MIWKMYFFVRNNMFHKYSQTSKNKEKYQIKNSFVSAKKIKKNQKSVFDPSRAAVFLCNRRILISFFPEIKQQLFFLITPRERDVCERDERNLLLSRLVALLFPRENSFHATTYNKGAFALCFCCVSCFLTYKA